MKSFFTFVSFIFYLSSFSQTEDKSIAPFLDGIVTQFPNVRDVALTSTNYEAIFSVQSAMGDLSALVTVKRIKGEWQNAEVVSFSGRYSDLEPFFSKDGLTLYFVSNRPMDQSSETVKDFDIWYVTRNDFDADWSSPINIGSPINTEMDEFYPSVTDSKNLYFTLNNPLLKQNDDIYVSEYINGIYTQPKLLSNAINSDGYEFNAFVAPDESFMIYTCYNREGGFGSGDLYISKKLDNGEWSPSKNMGNDVNSDKMDYCPYVDITSNMLYFTSKRNTLKPMFKSQVNLKDLLNTFNSYENGLSRLYKISIKGK